MRKKKENYRKKAGKRAIFFLNKTNVKHVLEVHKDEVEFVKQVPSHPRDRLSRKTKKIKHEVKFVKKVPSHPRDGLERKTNVLENEKKL